MDWHTSTHSHTNFTFLSELIKGHKGIRWGTSLRQMRADTHKRTHAHTHSHNQRDSQMGALLRSDKKGAKVRNVEHSCHGNAMSSLPARRTRFRSSATCANLPQSPWGKQEEECGSWGARKWLPIHLDEQQHRLQVHINLLWSMRPS